MKNQEKTSDPVLVAWEKSNGKLLKDVKELLEKIDKEMPKPPSPVKGEAK